jgi:hypothetical protein
VIVIAVKAAKMNGGLYRSLVVFGNRTGLFGNGHPITMIARYD